MSKSDTLYARIEPEVKEQAEAILSTLGIPASNAIGMFYRQIILHRGLPFEVTIPQNRVVDMSKLSREEMDAEIEKGMTAIQEGRVKPADEVFGALESKYAL